MEVLMSNMVDLTIDGKQVRVAEGTTIIDAAEKAGVHIPNLCYLKGMKGVGACRMCLVEVEGGRGPVTACTAKVKDGMNITTDSDKVLEMRRFVLDLILSMHPLDCMTCTKAGICNLQQYAYDHEVKESTFTRKEFGYPVDSANPFIKRDPEYCILCGKCVRACKEQGTNVLDFMGRGVGSKVITANDKPLQESECTFCGSCVDACPVNALLEADRWRKGREWEYKKTESTCLSCGNGCSIVVSTKDDEVAKINSAGDYGTVEKYICATGRFGFDALTSDLRVNAPMKRVGKKLEETTWDDALSIVAEKLKKSGKNASIVSTANILNEDAAALAKLASGAVKTKDVATTVSLYSDEETMKLSGSADLDAADVIITAGLNTSQYTRVLPALDAAIKKRTARGAKLIELDKDEAKSLAQIAKSLIAKGAKSTKELDAALAKVETTEDSDGAADMIKEAGSAVIFCSPSLFVAANNLTLVSKASVVAVPYEANARGVVLSGLTAKGKSYSDIVSGKNDVLYVIGEPPVKKADAKFLIVQTPYLSDLAKKADVVLPAASYLESSGTIVNYLGKVKKVAKAASPAGEAKQHKEIFADIAAAMKSKLTAAKVDVKKALKAKTKVKVSPFEKTKGLDVNPVDLNDSVNRSVINSSRLLWLKETEKSMASK
jgi:NADH dehydrogenase/NADH:ubiquinone oxidoreductase subunit G